MRGTRGCRSPRGCSGSTRETLEVLSGPEETRGIRRGRREIVDGRVVDLEDLLRCLGLVESIRHRGRAYRGG